MFIPDTNCVSSADFGVNPWLRRIAKSPTSCGTSWSKTASVVERPSLRECTKAAPSAKPSVKLWTVSAAMFSKADD